MPIISEPISVDAKTQVRLMWRDRFGLATREPQLLRIEALADEAPTVGFNKLKNNQVILSSEVVVFEITAGMPVSASQHVHVNDLDAVENLIERGNIACIILEPILQNIGVVKPNPGYLEGLRRLCDQYSSLLIFDEVKTGFRHALGGYQSICGVQPDLSVFGKAVANSYPLSVVGGKREYMEYFNQPFVHTSEPMLGFCRSIFQNRRFSVKI